VSATGATSRRTTAGRLPGDSASLPLFATALRSGAARRSPSEVMARHASRSSVIILSRVSELHPASARCLHRCLSGNPSRRPSSPRPLSAACPRRDHTRLVLGPDCIQPSSTRSVHVGHLRRQDDVAFGAPAHPPALCPLDAVSTSKYSAARRASNSLTWRGLVRRPRIRAYLSFPLPNTPSNRFNKFRPEIVFDNSLASLLLIVLRLPSSKSSDRDDGHRTHLRIVP